MKILMLAPQPFFEPRGTPISVLQRLMALSKLGYEIDLVTYHLGGDIKLKHVTIYRTPPIPFIKKIKIGPSWMKPFLDVLLFIQAFILLVRNRYDVIHTHEEASFMAIILSPLFRTYHIYDMHSSLPHQLENFKRGNNIFLIKMFEVLEKLTLHTCHAVITVGDDLEAYVKKVNSQVMHTKIENISLRAAFSPTEEIKERLRNNLNLGNKPLIVYTGTFEAYQGLDLLVESAEIVRRTFSNVVFLLVGGRPEQVGRLQDCIKSAGLEENFIMVGIVSPVEALAYADLGDILVSPRVSGTSVPLKIYSYLESGKPIVATRIDAHTQVMDERAAMFVDTTPQSLAAGILRLIHDRELRKEYGNWGKQLVEESYNFDSLVTKWQKAYLPFYREHVLPLEPTPATRPGES